MFRVSKMFAISLKKKKTLGLFTLALLVLVMNLIMPQSDVGIDI